MRTIIVCTQIVSLLLVLHGGILFASTYRGWGLVLIAIGAGWNGILSAALFTLIRDAKELPECSPNCLGKLHGERLDTQPEKEDHE